MNDRKLTWEEQTEVERVEREAQHEAWRKRRREYREKLFGSTDPIAWQAPPADVDFDALLAQHAAQLRNAVSLTMEYALSDDVDLKDRPGVLGSLTRMIQTNVAIVRVLRGGTEKSKTVHGGTKQKGTPD